MGTFSSKAAKKLKELDTLSDLRGSEIQRQQTLEKIESGVFAKEFTEWVQTTGRTEKDIKVACEDWVNDWNLINGDLRINSVIIGGAA